jgi:sulfate adenylyltransferase subunit 1
MTIAMDKSDTTAVLEDINTDVSTVAANAAPDFDIRRYLAEERAKDLLRFSTAGSVDDGKSTLIGRLLYDTQSVYEDQVRAIEGKGTTAPGVLDLALLTDGLRAEREQGITIDVAYRYFSTPRRKFIIADTPGHEQYTRNMATGASTADVAIVLIDARKGVLPQSRRHAYITALLGVRQVIVAVNKMDLVEFSESVFTQVQAQFAEFLATLTAQQIIVPTLHFVPVSALAGDNVVHRSKRTPWYSGPSLLELLEELPSSVRDEAAPFRFSVQRVTRPNLDFRGFAGQIASGTIRPGDRIRVLPSGCESVVERIVTFDGDLVEAAAPLSVTLTLADEIDISRGDLITSQHAPTVTTSRLSAALVWMDQRPLELGRRYLLKHASRTVPALVRSLQHTVDLSDEGQGSLRAGGTSLTMNGIAQASVQLLQPLAVDLYSANRQTGSFVLLDAETNATVAAGMVRAIDPEDATSGRRVEAEDRSARYGHVAAEIIIRGRSESAEALLDAVERVLFTRGAVVLRWQGDAASSQALLAQGVLLLRTQDAADSVIEVHGGGKRASIRFRHDVHEATQELVATLQLLQILR